MLAFDSEIWAALIAFIGVIAGLSFQGWQMWRSSKLGTAERLAAESCRRSDSLRHELARLNHERAAAGLLAEWLEEHHETPFDVRTLEGRLVPQAAIDGGFPDSDQVVRTKLEANHRAIALTQVIEDHQDRDAEGAFVARQDAILALAESCRQLDRSLEKQVEACSEASANADRAASVRESELDRRLGVAAVEPG